MSGYASIFRAGLFEGRLGVAKLRATLGYVTATERGVGHRVRGDLVPAIRESPDRLGSLARELAHDEEGRGDLP